MKRKRKLCPTCKLDMNLPPNSKSNPCPQCGQGRGNRGIVVWARSGAAVSESMRTSWYTSIHQTAMDARRNQCVWFTVRDRQIVPRLGPGEIRKIRMRLGA